MRLLNWASEAYSGNARLLHVFWFATVLPSIVQVVALGASKELFHKTGNDIPFIVVWLVIFVYDFWLTVALWKCSKNSSSAIWKILGRLVSAFIGINYILAFKVLLAYL